MNPVAWIWLAILAASCLVWLIRHRQISHSRRACPPLHAGLYQDACEDLPAVSLIVAAKDEHANIRTCLESLARQDHPKLQIIAVNDRSEDDTGRIIDELAESCSRLSAVHVNRLRPGWFGKNNAMREGVSRATADWLCFTDADCEFTSPRLVQVAVRFAVEQGIDFLSVLPTFETHTFWERVIQPACGGIMMVWFRPVAVNDPKRRAAYANGAFMLMTRDCYEAIGGHERVRTEVNEDLHMARLAKRAGRRLVVTSNENLYRVRMYESLGQMWAGWTRIFFGCFVTFRRLLLTAVAVMVFSMFHWVSLIVTGVAWARDIPIAGGAAGCAAAGVLTIAALVTGLAQHSVLVRFYALSRIPPAYALTYTCGAAIGLAAIFNAMRRLGGRRVTTWRGTTYRGDRVESSGDSTPETQPTETPADQPA
jgi:glycosyltransferase involved in cell wall biosynthesis